MQTIPIDLLRKIAHLSSDEEQQAFLFQYPVLLSPSTQEALSEQLSQLTRAERSRLESVLTDLRRMRTELEKQPHQYPVGIGPIEQLWQQQSRGEITAEYAEQLAAAPDVAYLLAPVYAEALSRFNYNSAHEGGWRPAVTCQRLLLSAVRALPIGPETHTMLQLVSIDWVEIVHIALMDFPDGRLYRKARAVGDQMVEQATASGDKEFLGDMLHRLGTLHLDPYTARFQKENYQLNIERWLQRAQDELGEELAELSEDEWRMPEPEEALRTAEEYLRKALTLRMAHEKGLSLKALAQTLAWLKYVLERPVDRDELIHVCQQALDSLGQQDPQHRLQVLLILRNLDEPIDASEIDTIFQTSLDEYVRRLGIGQTVDVVMQAATVLQLENASLSLEVLRNARSLIDRYANEATLRNYWATALRVIKLSLVPEVVSEYPEGGLQIAAQQLRERATRERWDVRKQSAALISLARHTSLWEDEADGLELINEAEQLAPLFTDDYAKELAYLRALLLMGVGVNGVNNGAWGPAIAGYTRGLRQSMDLNLDDFALDLLRRVDDLSFHQEAEVATQVVLGVAPLALRLERSIGEPATNLIQLLCKRTIAAMTLRPANPEQLFFLLQVAKGLRFATALYAGSSRRWQEDEQGMYLLNQAQELESALLAKGQATASANQESSLDENVLLTAYARPNDLFSGDTLNERLRNLQHSYDVHLNERILTGAEGDEALYLPVPDLQDALDERTVLLIFYLGASSDGQIAVYTLALTRGDMRVGATPHGFPDSARVRSRHGDREIEMSPFAFNVALLREDVGQWPGPRLVAREAEQQLAKDLTNYFGGMTDYLDELHAAGLDHLCIVPHGPLHYYPFHLLGEPGKPLADKWKVTYLPNLHLFVSRSGQPAVRKHRDRALTSIGIDYEHNSWGLQPLPQAVAEAREVASFFGTEAISGEQATKQRLLEALDESRYVHLSVHGQHNANAPAFQCLYLMPDDRSDGRLYAHELLSRDLRGVQVLTLSACETALGRFDTADNLRGLPASFLLAGVSTIIGTLWEVETNVSKRFFSSFYRQSRAGTDVLEGFAIAQRETRADFPKYRDWGPFYLMGDWR